MIEFQNVSKTYPNGTHALHDVSLHIDRGEFVFIVGASGAGKSTFLKLIMREETPTSGEIMINGQKLSKLKRRDVPYLRRHMGIVFQDFRLIEKMTVFDNVAFAMRAVGESSAVIKKRVPYVLGLVGLKDKLKNKPSELSGGEQQRVSLARALVNNPEIIVADEPTGNVDPELSHEIIELLSEINSMGTTVLVVTHEHELVREFNQRVVSIDKGRIVGDTKEGYVTDDLLGENFGAEPYDYDDEEVVPISAAPAQDQEQPEAQSSNQPAEDIEIVPDPAPEPEEASDEEEGFTDISQLVNLSEAYADEPPRYPDNVEIVPED